MSIATLVRRLLGCGLILVGVTMTWGCGSTLVGSSAPSTEVQELKSRVLELQRQVTVHRVELERLRRRIAELEGQPLPPPLPAPPPSLRERLNDDPVPPPPPEPRIQENDLEPVSYAPPPSPPSNPPAPPPPELSPPPSRPVASESAEAPVTAQAQALYDEGYTLYHQGRYLDAETRLRSFLQAHGDTELADNAQFWIGASRFARGDHNGALSAFLETVERYPNGNKVPDALYKAGQCLEALGDRERARYTYQEVLQRFPGSSAALNAEEELQNLR
jgi:tol-pal system protein YbgF